MTTSVKLDDTAVDRAAERAAVDSLRGAGVGTHYVTVELPVYADVAGNRLEIGKVTTEVEVSIGTEASPDTIPPGPARAPDPEAVDTLDAERAERAQRRIPGVATPAAAAGDLPDVTAYECVQQAAVALRCAAGFIPEHAAQMAAYANAWLSLALALGTHTTLNKPSVEGDR